MQQWLSQLLSQGSVVLRRESLVKSAHFWPKQPEVGKNIPGGRLTMKVAETHHIYKPSQAKPSQAKPSQAKPSPGLVGCLWVAGSPHLCPSSGHDRGRMAAVPSIFIPA